MRGHIALQSILREMKTLRCRVCCSQRADPSAEDLGLQTCGEYRPKCRQTSQYSCRIVRTGLSACFAYLVGVDAVHTDTDFSHHRFTAYGRGAGVGRGLGVGMLLGVGVAVEVGVAVAVVVAVAVGVGLAPATKLNLPIRVFQPAL